jgi:hypothetical protein
LTRVTNLGPNSSSSVVITYTMPASDILLGGDAGCTGGAGFGQCVVGTLAAGASATKNPAFQLNGSGITHTITATVGGTGTDPNTGNNQRSQSTRVTASLRTAQGGAQALTLQSMLDVRPNDGRVRARITLNDAVSEETTNSGPRTHAFSLHVGENRVAAQVELDESKSGTWRFDFIGSRSFLVDSLRLQSGRVISQDANSIVFALDRDLPELRFTFVISESTP